MTFSELTEKLRLNKADLPGESAQLLMAPLARAKFPMDPDTIDAATRSAVLVLLYPKDDRAHTVLIKRNSYVGVHSAQVSFPGGRHEEADADYSATAIREAQEEIGIEGGRVQIIKQLTQLYIPPSRFLVYPFLATANERPDFSPDPKEVQFIIELELQTLQDDDIAKSKQMTIGSGLTTHVPYFDIDGHDVWGATAMILSELKALLRSITAR